MNYGFEERPSRTASIASVILCGFAGIIVAVVAFFFATALFFMIANALPAFTGIAALATYIAFLLVPALAFAGILRSKEARFGPRVIGTVAIVVLTILAAGEITGLLVVYPHHAHFYITPGPF